MDETVKIEKLVHGGQGLATMADGRKVFVWNALPGEEVQVQVIRKKRDYAEAIATKIVMPSNERVEPAESNYLSTSPWQIMTYPAENIEKRSIVQEIFTREHIDLPEFTFTAPNDEWNYRNKMEFSFWGDDDGLHLALHQRGTRGKQILTGSKLALEIVNEAANKVLTELMKHNIRAGELKTLIVRASQDGEVASALFVKNEDFKKLSLPEGISGLRVYYSNPKSPASVATKLLYEEGSALLTDDLMGKTFSYDVNSFFQVNIPIFEKTLSRIAEFAKQRAVVDMYGGVGSIGLSVSEDVTVVELDDATAAMAKVNAQATGAQVVIASSEKALEYIVADKLLIVDPPRAGLHKKVVERINTVLPERIIYLSCNPATQARDIKDLLGNYKITFFEGYNFFPRTPHIETLAILERQS